MTRPGYEAERRARLPWRGWYKLATWRRLRLACLARRPLCERCEAAGRTVAATVVNHRKAHRGDWDLFVDEGNHESLCKPCHDSSAQREDQRGFSADVDADGWPADARHPANGGAA